MQGGDSPINTQKSVRLTDALLLPYLRATDETESHRLAAQLISDHAEPVIRAVIRYKLHVSINQVMISQHYQDAEDVYSDIILKLLIGLQENKADPDGKGIRDFHGYVATLAYHACSKYLREKHPQRSSLKNKLRYVLTRWPGFALWKGDGEELLCGFVSWQQSKEYRRDARLQQLQDNLPVIERAGLPSDDPGNPYLVDLLTAIFNCIGNPIKLDDLVSVVAKSLAVKDHVADNHDDHNSLLRDRLPDPQVNVADEVEQRMYLQRIWAEIGKLPLRQRKALLLNLRDPLGRGVIALLPIIGIASFREIAEVLDMPVEHLADLWNNLPLDDATIASHLDLTRQQVINLRKSARERLVRRVRAFEERT